MPGGWYSITTFITNKSLLKSIIGVSTIAAGEFYLKLSFKVPNYC